MDADDNQVVSEGEQLVLIRSEGVAARKELLDIQLAEVWEKVASLEILLAGGSAEARMPGLDHPRREELIRYQAELASSSSEMLRSRRELERSELLSARALAPAAEVETRRAELQRLVSDSAAVEAAHRSRWAAELQSASAELARIRTEIELSDIEGRAARITAPVGGTLDEVTPISPGSYLAAGTTLFILSPRSEPVAEVYVPAEDIGLVQLGTPVRILVDSFDYAVWGHLNGTVRSISPDHIVVRETPVFVVEVALGGTSLRNADAVEATVAPGMTIQAHLELARRSLWQLLRDDVGDWMNPQLP